MMTRARAIDIPTWAGKAIVTDIDANVILSDLGHRPIAMVHGDDVPALGPCGPGNVVKMKTGYAGVLSPKEAVILDLTGPLNPEWPESNYTDISDGYVLLGLWGAESPGMLQRLVSVDVERPDLDDQLFLATSSHGIFVYVINLKLGSPGFLMACARSDAQSFFDGLLHIGKPFSLKLAGTESFDKYLGGRRVSRAKPHI